jgi:hypothetical protein
MKPDPKPEKTDKKPVMSLAEFRRRYGQIGKATKRKPRKRAKTSRQKLIDEADRWFSRRVRLEAANGQGIGNCIDCGKAVQIVKADCGHFYSRRHLATRWDIDNAHLQAKRCNLNMGRPEVNEGYRANLLKKIGTVRMAKLEVRRLNLFKPGEFELNAIIDENKARVSYLLHKKKLTKWW